MRTFGAGAEIVLLRGSDGWSMCKGNIMGRAKANSMSILRGVLLISGGSEGARHPSLSQLEGELVSPSCRMGRMLNNRVT